MCAGEENLVTVIAHTTNGTDPFLHYVIDGHMGQAYPVTLWTGDDGGVLGEHTVTVFGRNNVATTVPLPHYEVKDCRPTYLGQHRHRPALQHLGGLRLQREGRRPAAGADRGRPQARRSAAPVPKPFKRLAFNWSFGDGETATTLTPVVEHNYEGREQKTDVLVLRGRRDDPRRQGRVGHRPDDPRAE